MTADTSSDTPLAEFEKATDALKRSQDALSKRIFGQDETIKLILTTLAAGGHGLLVGAPGLAKTLLVTSIADLFELSAKRIQFTPDLMPGDILGSEVLEETDEGKRAFRFIKGPIFCQLLMADEINRASPRTQSALLQAMQERFVTIAGERHLLPAPFQVLATQNPIEQEGTYPLPEAQLDRFLLQVNIGYPDRDAEKQMLTSPSSINERALQSVLTPETLMEIQSLVQAMPIADRVVEFILSLVRSARPTADAREQVMANVEWGPGPRACQALSMASRAYALIDGRQAPSIEDVSALAAPVLRHRMALNFNARAEGVDMDSFITDLVDDALNRQ